MGLNCISFVINPFRPAEGTRIPDFGIGRHEVITIAAALFKDNRARPRLWIGRIPKLGRRTGVGGRLLRVGRLISIIGRRPSVWRLLLRVGRLISIIGWRAAPWRRLLRIRGWLLGIRSLGARWRTGP